MNRRLVRWIGTTIAAAIAGGAVSVAFVNLSGSVQRLIASKRISYAPEAQREEAPPRWLVLPAVVSKRLLSDEPRNAVIVFLPYCDGCSVFTLDTVLDKLSKPLESRVFLLSPDEESRSLFETKVSGSHITVIGPLELSPDLLGITQQWSGSVVAVSAPGGRALLLPRYQRRGEVA